MSPLKIALMFVVFGLTACVDSEEEKPRVPATPAPSVDAPRIGGMAPGPELPACVPPTTPAPDGQIAPGCYTVCNVGGTAEHPAEEGLLKSEHLQVGDGVEIGRVRELTMVSIRPTGNPDTRPDELWPTLGNAQKNKLQGAQIFVHTFNGGTLPVPHMIEITRDTAPHEPGCTGRNNRITLKFCTDMTFIEGGAMVTKFLCEKQDNTGDQGHVHAEN